MTKKEIKDLAKELLVNMNATPLEMDATMDDKTLDMLSAKIVAKFVQTHRLDGLTLVFFSSLSFTFS